MVRLFASAVLLCACVKPAPLPTPYSPEDGYTVCATYCSRAESSRCPGHEGSPGEDETLGTRDDVSCFEVCRDTLSHGVYSPGPASCFSIARSCADLDICLLGE